MSKLMQWGIDLVERGWVPEFITRAAIRRLLRKRLQAVDAGSELANREKIAEFVEEMRSGPIAPVPEAANEQHYEVPAEMFVKSLGSRMKYSCCWWESGTRSLDEAEENALRVTCQRAEIKDGQKVLELGCGWGSLTLWIAEHFPNCEITAVSNSASQREFILNRAEERGIDRNLTVITADMNDFEAEEKFDRVVSVEMFEHMRNYKVLLQKVNSWLTDQGKLFVHIFCHKEFAYEFVDRGSSDWMSRYFFTGGIMPNEEIFSHFGESLAVEKQWSWNGKHYEKTSNAWAARMLENREELLRVTEDVYGKEQAIIWFNRWRMFYFACAELFGFNKGEEWKVGHYLLSPVNVNSKSEPRPAATV